MHCDVVSILTWDDDDIESYFCKVGLIDTLGMDGRIDKKYIRRSYSIDEVISTVTLGACVVAITYIFRVIDSCYYRRVDTSVLEPLIDHGVIVISISWRTLMKIRSTRTRKNYVPIMCRTIETTIICIRPKSSSDASIIVPWDPCRANSCYIDSRDRLLECWSVGLLGCLRDRRCRRNWWDGEGWSEWLLGCILRRRNLGLGLGCDFLRSCFLDTCESSIALVDLGLTLHLYRQWWSECHGSSPTTGVCVTYTCDEDDTYEEDIFHGYILPQYFIIAKNIDKENKSILLIEIH